MVSAPLDLGFTTFVDYPATPNTPGAADIGRIQGDISWLASPPSASLSFTTAPGFPSGLAFFTLQWNNIIENNTAGMIATATNLTHYTDRITFPYPGKYKARLTLRTQYSASSGIAQAQIIYTDTGGDQVADGDEADCNTAGPRWLKCEYDFHVDAGHIANGACVRAQYVQNSGVDATVTSSTLGAYPRLTVTWIGNS